MDLGQVRAQNAIQRSPDVKRRRTDLAAVGPGFGQSGNIADGLDRGRGDRRFQLSITFLDLGLIEVVKIKRRGQGEDMFVPIIANQRGLDHLNGRMAAHIAVGRQYVRTAFARNDCTDDPHSGGSCARTSPTSSQPTASLDG